MEAACALLIGYAAVLFIGVNIGGFMKNRKNEKTSARIATKASRLLKQIPAARANLVDARGAIDEAISLLDAMSAVSASALTQREKE